MKFSKLDLLTLLISLFLFSSCKDSSSIGLDVDANTAIQGILLDTVTVTSRTLKDDSASTYPVATDPSTGSPTFGLSKYPLGAMTDAVFGKTNASLAMSVTLPSAVAYSFGKNAIIDSAVLVMPYAILPFYGDSTAVYNINVNQLSENLSTQTTFFSSKQYAAIDALGSHSGAVKPNTLVRITDIVSGGPDTALNVVPQIRIKLNASMIQSKIMNLDSVTLSTNAKFNAAFKGLKVAASTSAQNGGGIMFLDFGTGNSNLEIYYKKQNETTTTLTDTVVVKFPIIKSAAPIAATVTHDYKGTPVEEQLKTPKEYQTTYLQALSGLKNKISFPYLKDLRAKVGAKMVINKAELVVDISDPADSIPFKIAPRLALYSYDLAEQRQQLPDNNPYSSANPGGDIRTASSGIPFGGFYDKTKKSYTFIVTNYIQDIVDGKIIDYGTFLAPTSLAEFNVLPRSTTAERAVIGSFNNTNNRKIRLNIYYTKAK